MGWVGVDLFFVLSGFLITGILYDAKASRRHYFRNFYARRVLRIFPLYYLFLAIVLIALPLLMPLRSGDYHQLHHNQVWLWPYFTNIWIALRDGSNIDLYGTGHLWSLAVEEQFYIVWPLVVLAFSRRSLMVICAACVVGALALRVTMNAAGTNPFVAYTFTPAPNRRARDRRSACDARARGPRARRPIRADRGASMHRANRGSDGEPAPILGIRSVGGGLRPDAAGDTVRRPDRDDPSRRRRHR